MKRVFQILWLLGISMYILSCSQQEKQREKGIKTGIWRGVISLPEKELPFNFEVQKDKEGNYSLFLLNASERLAIDSISIRADSIYMPMHIFDAQIVGKITESSIEGFWIKNYAQDYRIPFKAAHGIAHRFESNKKATLFNVSGKYAIRFADRPDSIVSVGVFEQQGNKVTGTILTRTGDYRYLEGIVDSNEMKLSAFDGEHAYLIEATIQSDSTMKGSFYSGKAKGREWRAVKDANARLADPKGLTYLKKGYEKIDFSFPSAKEGTLSLRDAKYEGKVVILQLFGTWCPNCMDETRFLSPWYDKNKSRGVEIIGLAYEKKADLAYARSRVRKMKERLNISYDFAIAGTSETESASKSLPMLNGVMAFPTTIFLDKKGNVRRIHTGFSGPGTGTYYEELVSEFNLFVDKLLGEEDSQGANKK